MTGLWRLAPVIVAALLSAAPAQAGDPACPTPDEPVLEEAALPRTRVAVIERKRLVVLAVGGSATLGTAAAEPTLTFPARLAARLREAIPGIDVKVEVRAAPSLTARAMAERLERDLADTRPDLVVWGVGGTDAARHVAIDAFSRAVRRFGARVTAAAADLIVMDPMYAPSIAGILDLVTYRDAIAAVATSQGHAVLPRHDLMRKWGDSGAIDFDSTSPEQRVRNARFLFDCFAAVIADSAAAAARR